MNDTLGQQFVPEIVFRVHTNYDQSVHLLQQLHCFIALAFSHSTYYLEGKKGILVKSVIC